MFTAIPIRIHPLFWLLVIAISAINSNFALVEGMLWALIIIVSVVVHEFGHALTAKAFGQRVSIELIGFGGLTKRHGPPLKLWKEFIIVACGPIAGLLLCGLFYLLLEGVGEGAPAIVKYTLAIGVYANLFWTAINLLPVQPLDGGHLVRIALEGLLGLRGIKTALFISMLVSIAISMYFLVSGLFFIGAFFLMFTFESYRSWQDSLVLTDQDRDLEIQQLLKNAEREYQRGELDSAAEKVELIFAKSQAGVLYLTAVQLKADILFDKGLFKEAYDLLLPYKSKLSTDSLQLLHQLAYRRGEWQEAIALGNTAYRHQPSYETALINALCYGILGQAQPAVGWLKCALKEGLPNIGDVLKKGEFNAIRSDPQFQSMLQQQTFSD